MVFLFEVKVIRPDCSLMRKVRTEASLSSFIPSFIHSCMVLCCLPFSLKENLMWFHCCLFLFWFCQLFFMCVQQDATCICSPLCSSCSLLLTLHILLLRSLLPCFPVPPACSYRNLYLPCCWSYSSHACEECLHIVFAYAIRELFIYCWLRYSSMLIFGFKAS